MTTTTDALCVHCDAKLTPRDQADGWCDSCGKRLPSEFRVKQPSRSATHPATAGGARKWVVAIGGTLVALLGVAAAFAMAG